MLYIYLLVFLGLKKFLSVDSQVITLILINNW